VDSSVGAGVTYYEVEAVNTYGAGAASTQVSVPGAVVPGPPTGVSATPQPGGSVRVQWAAPASDGGSPVTGYQVAVTNGATLVTTVATAAGTTSAVVPGLVTGTAYTFTVSAVNAVGTGGGASAVATADATAPTAVVTAPVALFQASRSIAVRWRATDADSPSGLRYTVRYRSAAWNGAFSGYATLAAGTTATSATATGAVGREYCFSVQATDPAGNVSAWSAARCTVVPMDDRSLAVVRGTWNRLKASADYLGTVTRTTLVGAQLRAVSTRSRHLALVVTTCATCGSVGVYVAGKLWRTVSTASARTRYKVVIALPVLPLGTRTVVLRAATRGKAVNIDGLGVAQT
jgi:hypothetical protein